MNNLMRLRGLLALTTLACTPTLGDVAPRSRNYRPSFQYPSQIEKPVAGSAWTPSGRGNFWLSDNRARRVGDTVVIVIEENTDARRGASTDLSREAGMSLTLGDVGSLLKYLQPELMGAELAGGKTGSDFTGSGTTARSEKLTARISATVKGMLPNGFLYIEGETSILVNRELQILYVSGVIRPADVRDDNTIQSNRVADAQIEFNGQGVISDKQGPGFLQRGIDAVNPF